MNNKISEEEVLADIINVLNDLTGDWEYSGEITGDTYLLADLEFESIDAVALGTAIEEHYGRSIPFAQYLGELAEQGVQDIRVSDFTQFIHQQLNSPEPEEHQSAQAATA